MSKKYINFLFIFGILMLLAGTKWDLYLTDFLYDPACGWAFCFQEIFPLLLKLWLCFCFMILRDNYSLLSYAAGGISAASFSYQAMHLFHISSYVLLALFFFAAFFGCYLLSSYLGAVRRQKLYPYIAFYVKVLLAVLLVTTVCKVIWGRIRYRDMVDVSQFSPWYVLFNRIGSSFPSGHTSSFVGSLLCLLGFPFPMIRKHHCLSCILAFALVVMMMISRMIMGAHFLSDTAAGLLIAAGCWFYFYHRRENEL